MFIYSICFIVIYASILTTFLTIISSVSTIANPEKSAPKTKYGGKIVVCQPGITEVAKSILTIECTENTRGVAKPANTNDTSSNLCQCFALPLHPKASKVYNCFFIGLIVLLIRSRIIAKSGIKPMYQKTVDTVRYVEIANTSQRSGELKFCQSDP